jgi:hypothetical protein
MWVKHSESLDGNTRELIICIMAELSGDRRRRVGSKRFVCDPISAGKAEAPGLLGASARMTWCAQGFAARNRSFECRSIPTVRAAFGAHR